MTKNITAELDFGIPEKTTTLLEDEFGTIYVAFYEDGTWWEGRYEAFAQGKMPKVQIENPPVRLHESETK